MWNNCCENCPHNLTDARIDKILDDIYEKCPDSDITYWDIIAFEEMTYCERCEEEKSHMDLSF